MKLLFENRLWLVLLAISLSMLGCNDKMNYQQFISRFQEQCPVYYTHKDLEPQKRQEVCDCMLKTTQQNYPDMTTLLAGIRAHDREPRAKRTMFPARSEWLLQLA